MREWALLAGGRLEIRNGSPRGVQVSLRVGALDERRPQAAAAEAPAATGRGPRPAARGVPAT